MVKTASELLKLWCPRQDSNLQVRRAEPASHKNSRWHLIWTAPSGQTYTTCPGSRLLFPTLCKPPHPLHHRPSRPGRIGPIEQAQRDDLDVGLAGVAGEFGRGHAVSVAPSLR